MWHVLPGDAFMWQQLRKVFHPTEFIYGLARRGFFNWLPDKLFLQLMYRNHMGIRLDLKNPRRFSEKLQWLKLYDRKPLYTQIVDKYAVRSYIEKIVGPEHLIPLLAVYDSVAEIDWAALPDAFALKCTHGSGYNIICSDKQTLDIAAAEKKLKLWLKSNWFYNSREWPYKHVRPRLICEKFMSEQTNAPDDYKVMCFAGVPHFIQLHKNRFTDHQMEILDVNWQALPLSSTFKLAKETSPKIALLDEVLEIAAKLAQGFPFIRIDLFIVNQMIYCNEMTLYDGTGFLRFNPDHFDFAFGDLIELDRA